MLLPTLATALGLIPLALTAAVQIPSTSAASSAYPITNQGNHRARDPNIIHYNNEYYLFQTGSGIAYSKASDLSGPWTSVGEVLDGKPSVIDKGNRYDPWAPTVIQHNNEFYCFYSVSTIGSRNSSIGVATSATLAPGSWTDHGALINTVSGQYSNISPYTVSNAIDPSVIVEVIGGQAYLTFGSYWTDIWQVPLTADLLSVQNPQQPNAKHLSLTTPTSQSDSERPEEASWISYKAPYYYLWFSKGFCCGLDINNLPPAGQEYSIRVGRSSSVTGPYLDKNNTDLLNGGGEVVYGSNSNGQVYAPGSSGVLTNYWGRDVLYYHYLNQSIGLANDDAFLGYNYLDYEGGWPVVTTTSG
ncbi:glycosyl hydrolase [Talaromyces proteolyticus]|uniref:Arabinan endo-1,5-alpha-L-arabinosidase n=1 Tax=Talaromyces proteolyticus TaxID=1131652 RepID=A0AAD4KLP3_9EURO|nr:glycosyl hydrolase [Talaromyces proteolyticus]KAH8693951.1 glycosyl hydrolase [Talaromyces proteolyticus]